jgi:hypothetical protein
MEDGAAAAAAGVSLSLEEFMLKRGKGEGVGWMLLDLLYP